MHGLIKTALMPSPQKSPTRRLKGWIKSFGKRKKGDWCQEISTFLLIVCIVTQTFAAPLNQPRDQPNRSDRQLTKKIHNRRLQMKNLEMKKQLENVFNGEDLYWKNPCGGIYIPSATAKLTPADFLDLKAKLNTTVYTIKSELPTLQAISTKEIGEWSIWDNTYKFLPTKPTHKIQKWHNDTQIFVASFTVLHRLQEELDIKHNDGNTMSVELKHITRLAKSLLCEIESFMNETSTEHRPIVLSRHEMTKLMNKFRSLTHINIGDRIFLKTRFNDYVNIMYKRLQSLKMAHLAMETKNGGSKRLKLSQPTKKQRRKHKKINAEQQTNSVDLPTRKPGMGSKKPGMGSKKPGLGKKKNRMMNKHNRQNTQNDQNGQVVLERLTKMRQIRTTKIIKQ